MQISTLVQLTSFLIVFISILFVLFLLTVQTKNKWSNRLLSVYLLIRALNISAYFYYDYISLPIELELLRMDIGSFLEFPVLYLFTLSVVYSDFKLKRTHIWHLAPLLLITIVQLPSFYLATEVQQNEFADSYLQHPLGVFSTVLAHAQNLFYIVLIFLTLARYKTVVQQNYALSSRYNYQWLYQMNVFIAVVFAIAILKNFQKYLPVDFLNFDAFRLLLAVSILIFTCWLVLKALHAPKLFTGVSSELAVIPAEIEQHTPSEAIQTQIDQLEAYMKSVTPYTNPELTIKELSEALQMEERALSILINRHLGSNFHRYINGFRIAKAQELLQNTTASQLTVLEILYQVGFNSKSSFNTYFKKETGYTPTAYRKLHT